MNTNTNTNTNTSTFTLVDDNAPTPTINSEIPEYFSLRQNDLVKLVATIVAMALYFNDDGRRCERIDLGYVVIYRYHDFDQPAVRLEKKDYANNIVTDTMEFSTFAECVHYILRTYW